MNLAGEERLDTVVRVLPASSAARAVVAGRALFGTEVSKKVSRYLVNIGFGTNVMSNTHTKINQALNRALRHVNEVAARIAESEFPDRVEAIDRLSQMMATLVDIQSALYVVEPDLEYHYDSAREATKFMMEIAKLVEQAVEFETADKFAEARKALEKARDLEPPPLTYEELTRRIDSLNKD